MTSPYTDKTEKPCICPDSADTGVSRITSDRAFVIVGRSLGDLHGRESEAATKLKKDRDAISTK